MMQLRFKAVWLSVLALSLSIFAYAQAPTGEGWSSKTVADGIQYYTFSGIDEVSGSAQQVFVIDLDLSNPRYALRFAYSPEAKVTSTVFKEKNAIVALNAAYEQPSVVIKVDGQMYSCMPADIVMDQPVPNWKSEGAIYTDGLQGVRIGKEAKGLDLAGQRAFYSSCTEPNILSSAPVLIYDYDPMGERFADSSLTPEQIAKLEYEDPSRHQGVRHPRTAMALTEKNHLLMVAVDGRRKGIGEGMTARELTRFLVKNFNPQYALNMDGGGSTTLCVRGEGDPVTNVVNYPTDNKRAYDHAGERGLYTHFYIAERYSEEAAGTGRFGVREEVLSDWNKSSGLDCVYDCTAKKSTPAPKGYEAVYVSHYGRHGSRYAYTPKAYTVILEMLQEASRENNVTPYGARLQEQLEAFWKEGQYKVGDLTPLGWQQHQWIARNMVKSFPSAFGKGSSVDACSSPSVRAIISMSSFVSSISREAPKAAVYAHQGKLDAQATRPNDSKNAFRYSGPAMTLPYSESSEHFFLRRFPQYKDVLARLFVDPDKALQGKDVYDLFFNLYMFVGGMNSIPEQERMDVSGIFTPEEYAILWETDGYERFREYYPYQTPNSSIVDDIIAKADARLSSGSRGADLRFGHDHVVMSLLMLMDIDNFGYTPRDADDLVFWFQTFRSCMGTNIQIVFYQKRRGEGDTLVKVLLNGEEASFADVPAVQGPYYRWADVRAHLQRRIAKFVDR